MSKRISPDLLQINIKPDGSRKPIKNKKSDSQQLTLFVGLESIDGSGWYQQTDRRLL